MIYFATTNRQQWLKIGFTTVGLHRRLLGLKSSMGMPFLPLGAIAGGPKMEAWLHRHFAAHRICGELYAYRPIKREIAQIITVGRHPGMPSADDAESWSKVKSLHGWGRGDTYNREAWGLIA